MACAWLGPARVTVAAVPVRTLKPRATIVMKRTFCDMGVPDPLAFGYVPGCFRDAVVCGGGGGWSVPGPLRGAAVPVSGPSFLPTP
ncbi:hypothetical protein GCM10018781_35880 [Kitasatospora indigofera]|uniref:Uncharacterized protein n=1 Tax=Kitasatospora indigofera TaxID=67307 RepID=A0A919FUL8_9ACTN|nr:hypothetical protein GCM10018781_35880 [Kitasatospora indigofera]